MALLDKTKLNEDFKPALQAMKTWWDNFGEYERIARNKPHPKVVAAKMPTVTDGTLSGVIRSQPKRVVQQIPTGRVTSVDQPDVAPLADYIVENEIYPNATFNGDVISKCWLMISRAETYGCSVSYAFFKNNGDYYGGDFSLPYIKDVIFQEGKSYGPDCKKLYLRQWYTEDDINSIIKKETRLTRNAKRRGDSYDPTWDKQVLRAALKVAKKKAQDALSPAERDKNQGAMGVYVQIIHAFEEGVGATFYSFCPDLEDGENIARTRINKDPMGCMPLSFMYLDYDLSNPLGIGYPEMSGALQNLLDSEVQSYQLMQKLMLAPPVMKWGKGIKGSSIKFKTNAVWDMGSDVNNKIEAVNINTEAIANFVNNYGLIKSQILNLTNNQDASVPTSAAGSTSQSKTPQGVAQQQQKIGYDDNFVRKRFEAWFQDNMERVINIHFAESDGEREVELTEDWLEDVYPQLVQQMQQGQAPQGEPQEAQEQNGNVIDEDNDQDDDLALSPQGQAQEAQEQPGNQMPMDENGHPQVSDLYTVDPLKRTATVLYGEIKTRFKFRVDPTSSEAPDDADQVTALKELLQDVGTNPMIMYYLANDGWQLHQGEAWRELIMRLGVANISKILTRIPSGQQPQGAGMGPMFDKPKVTIPIDKMPIPVQISALQNAGIQAQPQDFGVQTDSTGNPIEQTGKPLSKQAVAAGPSPKEVSGAAKDVQDIHSAVTQPPVQPGIPTAPPGATVSAPPQQESGAQPPTQLDPGDRALVVELLKAGYSSRQALYAVVLMHQGYNEHQIMQALGQPGGGTQ